MKSVKKIHVISFFAAVTILLIFGYSLSSINTHNIFNFFSVTDTLDNNTTPVFDPRDYGSSFNEKGYYKSSSTSFDEQEIINDYNGNLMYRIPLSQGKGQGDLYYDLSLNYNGNVNYQVITADETAPYWNFGQLHQYNVNAPGWIVSLNGLAVQMVNSETNFFTRPDNNSEAKGRYVRMLASGYHLTDRLTTADNSENNRDKITIMLGDGSTEVLKRESNYPFNNYTGWYKSTSKNSFVKAYVKFTPCNDSIYNCDSSTNGSGWARTMYLMKGDGLTYIYKETYINYYDHKRETGMAPWFYPVTFVMRSIKDRFGHVYDLTYNTHNTDTGTVGRPWLNGCPGGLFTYQGFWGTYFGLRISTSDGNYSIFTDPYGTNIDNIHRPNIWKILNPTGEQMLFEYEPYIRIGTNIYKNTSSTMTIKLGGSGIDPLYRLSKVTNFDGGIRTYDYASPNNLSMNYQIAPTEFGVHSSLTNYKGQGRDFFFSNMLSSVEYESGVDTLLKKTTFNYVYNYGNRQEYQIWQNPVCPQDSMITVRTIYSGNENVIDNETPDSLSVRRVYTNYRVEKILSPWQTQVFEGQIKLIGEEQYSTSLGTFKYVTHGYALGNQDQDTVFYGTLLNTLQKDSYNGVNRWWYTSYTGGGDEPITQRVTTDPLNQITTTNYSVFEKSNYVVFEFGSYNPQGSATDTLFFYLIDQPYEITVTKNGVLLRKNLISYYNPSDVVNTYVNGYPGQVSSEKIVDPANVNNFQEISYKYYNHDTTGLYMYSSGSFRSGFEGNLKEVTDANGNKTKYYYDLISRSEEANYIPCDPEGDEIACAPKFTYHKIKEDGTDILMKTIWKDSKFPSRIDRYPSVSYYLSNYQQYDLNGNPTAIVDPNNYLSQFDYDKYYRLAAATLPYDFSDVSPDTLLHIDTTISQLVITSYNTACGGIGIIQQDTNDFFGDFNTYLWATRIEKQATYGGGGGDQILTNTKMLLQFDNSRFNEVSGIDSAFFEFYPYYATATVNGNINDYKFKILPMEELYFSTYYNRMHYVDGNGYAQYDNLNISTNSNCVSSQDVINQLNNNYRKLDVSYLLSSNIENNELKLQGFKIEMVPPGGVIVESEDFEMYLHNCTTYVSANNWKLTYLPKLTIYARKITIDTSKTIFLTNGTVIYKYNDVADTISVFSKIDKPSSERRFKITTHLFDEFGKLKETKQYTTGASYNSFYTYYNYLDQKSKVIDARNLSTKYSYNQYSTLSKTENADNSYSVTSEGFYNSLTTYWGTDTGFIHEQIYTDETGRNFEKYFNAVGNLLREVKYVPYNNEPDTPYDPDSTYDGNDNPGDVAIYTDYRYDSLYRVSHVKTPEGKIIHYNYDAFGRQSSRTTPDAGLTKYIYDKNNNLTYSQDANQNTRASNIYTFRVYDGLNRLLRHCETPLGNPLPNFENLDGSTSIEEDDNPPTADDYLLINVYDTLSSAAIITFTPPAGYYGSTSNNTKGNIVATAYRTRGTDSWNFKYYRYDARSRVVKMWHYIDGLGWKIINNAYNSQNQLTYLNYNPGGTANKLFKYAYDDAARLNDVSVYVGQNPIPEEIEGDFPGDYQNFTSYTYNENSQVDDHNFNGGGLQTYYIYNNRNWVAAFHATTNYLMDYGILYLANGNIRNQLFIGSYDNNFANPGDLNFKYVYDISNRLLKADRDSGAPSTSYDLINTYDKDGNILTLKRYGSSNNLVDNFEYDYISGTNKLRKVAGLSDQYSYDYNGNVTEDDVNVNFGLAYDHRNLLVEFGSTRLEDDVSVIYHTIYYYDEAGNRIRKLIWKYNGGEPEPAFADDSPYWDVVLNEFYVRDISGKEIGIYQDTTLYQWNVWGLDNVGKIDSYGDRYFYLKDHLGSIRVVIDSRYNVVSAQDYDMWGNKLENRSYSLAENKYKFTSKQRDDESNYDYFGARYYDSKIGRWGGVEPLLDKFISISPYCYSYNNPIVLKDINGKIIIMSEGSEKQQEYLTDVIENYLHLVGSAELVKLGYQIADIKETKYAITNIDAVSPDLAGETGDVKIFDINDKSKIVFYGLGIKLNEGFFETENKYIAALLLEHELFHLNAFIKTFHGSVNEYVKYANTSIGKVNLLKHELNSIAHTITMLGYLKENKFVTDKEYDETLQELERYKTKKQDELNALLNN